jgi:predicted AAA+ superfamily ATPase
MILRKAEKLLKTALTRYPVVAVTGPRQSGKTTLCRAALPDYDYINLERPDNRAMVASDPLLFLGKSSGKGVIIDEAQRLPEIFSWIQAHVDQSGQLGKIIVSGSQNFLLSERISQSLAGRVKTIRLLPFSRGELGPESLPADIDSLLFKGLYPPVYDRPVPPEDWYQGYIETYLERDVRSLRAVADLKLFQTFLGLCAGRIGQLINFSSLAGEVGVSHTTIRSWFSVLEASYILFFLKPWHSHPGKRLTKQPKLYFTDTGLACALAGIRSPAELSRHYLRGSLFENLVILEYLKTRYNAGLPDRSFFWRDNHGNEVDLLLDENPIRALEIKSGMTFHSDMMKGLKHWQKVTEGLPENRALLYGGSEVRISPDGSVLRLEDLENWLLV